MADLQKTLDEIRDLPTLPDVVAKVNQLVSDPNTSAADINDVISKDPSLSARILKLVNSPFYGFPRRITTITYAVVILGFTAVRNLALSAFVFDAFKGRKEKNLFDLKAFWTHSITTAMAARFIARKVDGEEEEDAFMGGLLHDIGKTVMNQYLRDDLDKVVQTVASEDTLFLDAERAVLDYDHIELGALLLERWNLPPRLVEIVRYHRAVADASPESRKATAVVHLAKILVRALCIGNAGDRRIPCLQPAAWEALGLTWDEVDHLMSQIRAESDRARDFFQLG